MRCPSGAAGIWCLKPDNHSGECVSESGLVSWDRCEVTRRGRRCIKHKGHQSDWLYPSALWCDFSPRDQGQQESIDRLAVLLSKVLW